MGLYFCRYVGDYSGLFYEYDASFDKERGCINMEGVLIMIAGALVFFAVLTFLIWRHS